MSSEENAAPESPFGYPHVNATDDQGNDIVVHLLEYDRTEMAEWVRKHGAC